MTRTLSMMAVIAISALIVSPLLAQQTSGTAEAPPTNEPRDTQTDYSNDADNDNSATTTDSQAESATNPDDTPNTAAPADSRQTQASSQARNQELRNRNRQSNISDDRTSDQNRREQSYLERDARDRQDRRSTVRHDVEFGASSDRGLTITSVDRNSVFYDSGIRQNDVIISVDGRRVRNDTDFYNFVRPGMRTPVLILRDGREETVYITYDDDRNRFSRDQFSREYDDRGYEQSAGTQAYLGVRFEGRVRDAAVVASVISGSAAEEAGLQRGDEIVAINGREVQSPQEVTRLVASLKPGDTIDIDFSRRIDERTQVVLQGRDSGSTATTGAYRQEVYRGGPQYEQYDQMERREFDPRYSQEPQQRFDRMDDRYDGGLERRNTRQLLPRLRN
jgi:C-terminal processing protease CtpA/Prc